MVYMPMSYIYAKRFVGPITPVILAMRDELYNVPYDEINWNDARRSCCKDDIIYPPSWMQNVAMASLNKFVEPVFNMWPMNKIRQRALTNIMCHIHYEDENSNYVGLCPINKVLNMICCWIENPNSDAFRLHLPRIDDFLWLAEDGMKCKVYNGCQCWETALAVQAYCSTGLAQEFGATLKKAHDFIKNAQVIENCPNYKSFYRERSKGSWTLSNGENSWAMADCTAECLKAVLLLSKIPPNHVGDPLGEERLYDAVDCLLSFANKDGTLSSAESQRTTPWVEGVDGKPALTGGLLQLLVGIKNVVGNGAKEPAVACGESEVFQWLLLKDRRLNTRVCFKEDNLGHKMDQFCLMCNNSVLEDVQCLFFFCPFATVLALPWNKLGSELGIYDHCINRKVAIWQAFLCGSY